MAYRQEYATLTDGELVELFHSGEKHGSFTVLVERYQKRIYFAARKMLAGDHASADEIAQDTFVKAYEAMDKFRGDAQIYTWLYRIMMNAVIQRSRKLKVRPTVGLESADHVESAEEGRPDQQLVHSETSSQIEQAILTLPPKQRQVFIMRFYEELSYEEIAAIVGTSVGGLKANYFHAVKKVGEYMQLAGKVALGFGEKGD
jgi:RNA polymerase sigma-70 factor (ECF subfamily)